MTPSAHRIRCWLLGLALLAGGMLGWAQEYSGAALYTATKPSDTGGIVLTLAEGAPKLLMTGAFGRKSGSYYAPKVSADGRTLTWSHLPVDVYDLILGGERTLFEGLRLVRAPEATLATQERPAITKEVELIEGFYENKKVERLELEGQVAVALVQQWRSGFVYKQSGDAVKGFIHSFDLIWFERPAKGWQLLKRRQIYRAELAKEDPIAHQSLAALGGLRVTSGTVSVGPLSLRD